MASGGADVPVTLIEGSMGAGKTITATAFVVDAYNKDPSTRIYANYHLYGVKYVYMRVSDMIKTLNDPKVFRNAKYVIDEAYIEGECRRGNNPLTVMLTEVSQQMRKRKIELYIIVQNGRFLDWRFKWIMTRRIVCKYNEKTFRVKLIIKDMIKNVERKRSFWAPQYWKYYDTDELPHIPKKMVDRALEWA